MDDLLLMTRDEAVKDRLQQAMTDRFEEVKCEPCKSYLGLCIEKEGGNVNVTIPGYLKTMGDHLNIEDEINKYRNKRWDNEVPWDGQAQRVQLGRDERKVDVKVYQKVLGLLTYACNIRNECTVYVNMLASRQQDPRLDDYIACLRIIHYLRRTSTLGITFRPVERINGKIKLYCTADASFGLRRADVGHTGVTFSLGANGTPFYVISKKQATRSRSSTEAEIKAYNTCAAHITYFNKILEASGGLGGFSPSMFSNFSLKFIPKSRSEGCGGTLR